MKKREDKFYYFKEQIILFYLFLQGNLRQDPGGRFRYQQRGERDQDRVCSQEGFSQRDADPTNIERA